MRHRRVSIFLLILACAALALTAIARPPGSTSGSYNCVVAGDFSGEGTVTISDGGGTITFRIWVRDKAGNTGDLQATVPVSSNRFSGDGTVLGRRMRIQGRLDPADQQPREQLRGQRLVATFSDDARHHGRITGSPRLRGNGNQGQNNQGQNNQGDEDEGGGGGGGNNHGDSHGGGGPGH